jgi:ubiquinone/menaquinone biosynthesis C-methylase UbiE
MSRRSAPTSASQGLARQPADVVEFYSRVGRLFEPWARLMDSRARARIRELCAISDGQAVLDVGCGAGGPLLALAADNPTGHTVGVDLAPGMVRASRRRLPVTGVRVERANACCLPFADNCFDVVTSAYVLDIMSAVDIRRALVEFGRVLRPAGRLVLCHVTPAERPAHQLGDRLYGTGLPLTGNCRGIRLETTLMELRFVAVVREYTAQWGLPSEIIVALNGAPGHPR